MVHVKRWRIFLLFMALLIPLLLLVLLGSSLLNVFVQAYMPGRGGMGGAYGAYGALSSTINVAAQPKIYGGSGQGGACQGTYGAGNDMLKMDFGWSSNVINNKWTDYTTYRLCNDHYTWTTVTVLPATKVFQTLQWPSDLLTSQYANQPITLEPLNTFDPNTYQAQQQQAGQGDTPSACDWVPDLIIVHPHIDICLPLRVLVNAGSTAIRGIYKSASSQIDFLWQTPLTPFQDDKSSGLLTVWSTSWAIVALCITAVIAYGGLRYMLGSAVTWLAYANIAELVPRVLFGLLAAYFSKDFFIMLIQANNALAGVFNQDALNTVMNGSTSGIMNGLLQILYGVMGFLLIIEEVARIAVIYLLFAFAPVLFFFASLRETQQWAKIAATASILFVFMQAIQSATLSVGGKVITTVLHSTSGALGFLNLLVSLAILFVTLSLFFSLARMAIGGGAGPLGMGVLGGFAFARRAGPAAAGALGGAAGRLRQARTNMFSLPNSKGRSSGGNGFVATSQTTVRIGGTSSRSGSASGTKSGGNAGGSGGSGGGRPGGNAGGAGKPGSPGGPGKPGGNVGGPGNPGGRRPGGNAGSPAHPAGRKPGGNAASPGNLARPGGNAGNPAGRRPGGNAGNPAGRRPGGNAGGGGGAPRTPNVQGKSPGLPAQGPGAGNAAWQKTPPRRGPAPFKDPMKP